MSEINDKFIPIEEIDLTGQLIASIRYKPKLAIIICFGLGFLFIATLNIAMVLLGAFVVGLSWFVNYSIKDRKVVDIYSDNLVIFDNEQLLARKVVFEDIKEWTCKHGVSSADALMLVLEDGEEIYKNTFSVGKIYKKLNKLIPKKESQAIKDEESSKSKLKFRNPFTKKNKK